MSWEARKTFGESAAFLAGSKICLVFTAHGRTAPLWESAQAIEAKTEGRSTEKTVSIFEVMGPLILQETETKQICPVLRTSTTVHTCAVSDLRVHEWFSRLLREDK